MNHDTYPDSYIRGILNTVKTIAMVGISPKDNRPSYFAFKYLLERGYRMIPVNPGQAGKEILGQKVYAKLSDIPEPIDMVDVFRASQHARPVVEEALALKPQAAGDLDAARRAQRRGRRQGGSRRRESRDEPLPEDRIRPALVRDLLDRGEFAHPLVEARAAAGQGRAAHVAQSRRPWRRHDRRRPTAPSAKRKAATETASSARAEFGPIASRSLIRVSR